MSLETILIFGGSDNQRTLIQSAKQLGYRTIVIDPDPNAIAQGEADIFEVVGARDKEETIKIARKYNVKGIVTSQMENPLLFMAGIAKEMGYIFPTTESITKARNKWLMKQCFIQNGVPCAKGILLNNIQKLVHSDLDGFTFPLLIKPTDSFSSRGVYKVNNIKEIQQYINITRSFSGNGDVIIEEFMEGPEVSVESVTQNGITEVIQITDKEITPYPTAVEMAHIQPSNLEPETQTAIQKIVKFAIKALGLDHCATHAEVKITTQGVKMVEIGARLGGDYITSHLVPLSTGVNIEAAAVEIAMGKKTDVKHKFSKAAVIQYLNLPEGNKIINVGDWQQIYNNPCVKHTSLIAKTGMTIPAITDSAKRMGFVIVQYPMREEAISNAKQIANRMEDEIITD